ncbi:tetratricopeptide repeat protein [Crocosphaera watsonii]|uniref:DnaJ-class molecular chaperone n=1 Tax=Crocosphaera watsonii WH 0401 TaxID=555881 RepID=T2J3Y9_CROWT|nr:tetratricopeptide repeat protein [Crocosphaera watsonii]CCQ59734.1 DnaJ-class molecular chaperone [Crocosphaera watsonii WH 0401]
MGQNLADELSSITIATDEAQKLLQTSQDRELTYHRLLGPLVNQQYDNLDDVFVITAQISELNLIYLMLSQGEKVKQKAKPKPQPKPEPKPKAKKSSPSKQEKTKEETRKSDNKSGIKNALKRAEQDMERHNLSQAIVELREILKQDPNNGKCHGLLGLAYLKQEQLTMAKIHINKARKVSPQDPIVIKAKLALDKVLPESGQSKSSDKPQGRGFFCLFGRKK